MDKKEMARIRHEAGYNCAQAVACSFAEEVGVDEATLYTMCEGFGGGLGCAKGMCGALSGAVVLAGVMHSDGNIADPGKTKKNTTSYSAEMLKYFTEEAGALICFDLKGAGGTRPVTPCAKCIDIGVEAVQKVLGL